VRATPPAVTLGLPVYNGEKYLAHGLTRLLQQDYEDFDLIITDNASTDGTQEICRRFAERDPRIRYYRNATNIGLAANHNRAFELSNSKYFKWVAYDDDFPPGMLSGLVAAISACPPTVSLVYAQCEFIDDSGKTLWVGSDHVGKDSPWPHKRLSHFLRNISVSNSMYGLIPSEVLRKTRLHGLFPISDHVLVAELAMLGILVEVQQPLLRIRQHSGRTFTATKDPRTLRELYAPGKADDFPPVGLRTHMELELIKSAATLPLSMRDRILCTATAIVQPQVTSLRTLLGRYRRKLFRETPAA